MPDKKFWEPGEEEHEDVEAAEEEDSWVTPDPVSEPEPEPEPAPARFVPRDEGAGGRGGSYILDEKGNRVLVSGTKNDGAKDLNRAANKGAFAGRKHRERPPQ
jgi:hypothetical protein